ncbi:MAG: hypothetical protein K8E66_00420, partial [Phycisphaerales bacterium]|nr:hypothetical protein [Phycisphaerales bacterium]
MKSVPMRNAGVAFVILSTALLPRAATARTMTLPIERTAVISDEGDHRVLFALGERDRLAHRYIDGADLVLTLPADLSALSDAPIEIQVYGVTRPWTEGADWRGGWERPGGDVDADIFARTTVVPDRLGGTLRIPIGTVLRESLQGEELFGMLVTLAPYSGRGLSATQLALLVNVANAHV